MGHGSNDKLYITHTEHSGALGQHSASGGYKAWVDNLNIQIHLNNYSFTLIPTQDKVKKD